MGKYIKGESREQMFLTPRCVDEYVDANSETRVIDEFVNMLDMGELGFLRSKPNYEGTPGYDPRDILKLYIYGYLNRIRSSRRLEKETKRNLEVIWLLRSVTPNFRTISDFRKDNHKVLKKVLKEFNKMCVELDLFARDLYSQDGTKIRAVNAKDKNFTKAKLDKRLELLEEKISSYLEELDKKDIEEKREEVELKLEEAKARMKKYAEYLKEMEDSGENQKSITDPESRLMKSSNGGFDVSYNIQTVVEGKNHFVAGFKTTNEASDNGLIEEVSGEVKKDNELDIMTTTVDGGYVSEEDIRECLESGIVPVLPETRKGYYEIETRYEEAELTEEDVKGKTRETITKCLRAGVIPEIYKELDIEISIKEEKEKTVQEEEIGETEKTEEENKAKALKGYFVRDIKRDIVYCPQGKKLRRKSTNRGNARYYNSVECKKCKKKCTTAKTKTVDFKAGQVLVGNKIYGTKVEVREKNKEKTEVNMIKVVKLKYIPDKEKYKRRKELSEHVFGTLKRYDDGGYLLLKGKEKVEGELSISFLTYNIRRFIKILGVEVALEKIKEYSGRKIQKSA